MKPSVFAVALALAGSASAPAATTFVVDPGHSDVSFEIRHLMSRVRGTFNEFSGTIVRDDQEPSNSSVRLVIQAASIDTRHEGRDDDLRGAEFFDVESHPTLIFESTKVEKVSEAEYRVTGRFTMRGVTKELVLPVRFEGEMKDPRGTLRVGYSTATRLDRKEYGMNWNRALDNGGFLLSDEVDVSISVEAKQQP
jgi:polyisoprenoid-binding protein YceI